ncbi:LytTR family transcriptional regulator DNA-binding domain-containing protein [Luteibacter aegosomatis]|uniref:LytR/AlgR family response regulator transcription factor n=1 Tax=Luteibacter aegosomatis TaxID=2911537 RepID=UPI001FFA24DF|nr:LytTR family transcriptional regulator DNA-binding domain-containing protein [Luteibacter aegosomatis]UPG85609.1 LytTR family transcriptional regulator DNA-binding domain-containing protein [Luteibacter aegosomatis]
MSIRALLVDDEMLARLAIRQALASHPDVEVVGECANATEARQAMAALEPDLLFLDIRMPGVDGFYLLDGMANARPPMVVFATADARHALQAFDVNAIDYLLKPIDQGRFDQAMARVRRHRQGLGMAVPVAPPSYLRRISVTCGERVRVIATEDIDWIRADGNYVHIHAAGASHLHREPLSGLLAALDPARFLRIHRGIVVNMERIAEIHPLFRGSAKVVLRDGTHLSLSRRFRASARHALGMS